MARPHFKYIVDYGEVINCPSCDGGVGSHLEFYKHLKDLLKSVLDHMQDREYRNVYSKSGRLIASVGYNFARHSVSEVLFELERRPSYAWRTADDGHGNRIWMKKS